MNTAGNTVNEIAPAGPHAYERLSVLSGALSGAQTVMISILVALGVLGMLLGSAFVGTLFAVSA